MFLSSLRPLNLEDEVLELRGLRLLLPRLLRTRLRPTACLSGTVAGWGDLKGYVRGVNTFQYCDFHFANIAMVSCSSNRPQHGIRNYVGVYISSCIVPFSV